MVKCTLCDIVDRDSNCVLVQTGVSQIPTSLITGPFGTIASRNLVICLTLYILVISVATLKFAAGCKANCYTLAGKLSVPMTI